jgi:hypothetical protein
VMFDTLSKLEVGDTACRSYLADTHITSAFLLAERTANLDAEDPRSYERMRSESHAGACSAVLLSVAFLEAFINELLANASDGQTVSNSFARLPGAAYRRLALLWRAGVPRRAGYAILDKYRLTLIAADKPPLDEGRNPFQDTHALITLRNALTHYEPEWVIQRGTDESGTDDHKLTRLLRAKFPSSRFVRERDPWYPDHCLGAGCALWAARTSLSFAHDFIQRLDWPEPGLHLRGKLPSLAGIGVDPAVLR